MNTMPSTTPARAQTKQIVSFVVACVLLVLGLLILLLPTGLNFDPGSSSESTEAGLPGGELIGLMMVAAALAFIGMLVFGFVATCWGIGLILAARLALNKTGKRKGEPSCKKGSPLTSSKNLQKGDFIWKAVLSTCPSRRRKSTLCY